MTIADHNAHHPRIIFSPNSKIQQKTENGYVRHGHGDDVRDDDGLNGNYTGYFNERNGHVAVIDALIDGNKHSR